MRFGGELLSNVVQSTAASMNKAFLAILPQELLLLTHQLMVLTYVTDVARSPFWHYMDCLGQDRYWTTSVRRTTGYGKTRTLNHGE